MTLEHIATAKFIAVNTTKSIIKIMKSKSKKDQSSLSVSASSSSNKVILNFYVLLVLLYEAI